MDCPTGLRLGLLVSGAGRTALNLHRSITAGELAASIEVVISSRPNAPAVEKCRAAGLRVEVVDRRSEPGVAFDRRIAELLRGTGVDLVCLAGFLHLWRIPADLAGRVINIHPALLPAFGGPGFYGDRVHQAVLASGATESGCTVHFADDQYDHGPIILQRRVPVRPDDTVETLSQRVFEQELRAYPAAIHLMIDGRAPLPHPELRASALGR